MKEELAERLLAHCLQWDDATAQREVRRVQQLAARKYDRYHNFEPGMRFVGSLARWLSQFETPDERACAYNFVISRLVFISSDELNQLVDLAYPERILPILLKQTAEATGVSEFRVAELMRSETFRCLRRRSLFLGLSDGARVDSLRRRAGLNNEQVSVSYEVSASKIKSLQGELAEWLSTNTITTSPTFQNLFLVDDFSGSGTSILRQAGDGFKGKLHKLHRQLEEDVPFQAMFAEDLNTYLLLYVSTEMSSEYLKRLVESRASEPFWKGVKLLSPLQVLGERVRVPRASDEQGLADLIERYYDDGAEDKHTGVGGATDLRRGYAACALPLVFEHNCPNNSLALLWAELEESGQPGGLRALFPRVSRHRDDRT